MPHSYVNFCHLEGFLRGPITTIPHPRGEGVAFTLEVKKRMRISKSEWSTQTEVFDVEAGPSHYRFMMHRQDGDFLAIDGQVRTRRAPISGTTVLLDYVYALRVRKLEIVRSVS